MDRKTNELKESCKCDTLSPKRINVSCHKRTIISENPKGHNSLTPWSILVSFCMFPMMPDTLSIIPVTS